MPDTEPEDRWKPTRRPRGRARDYTPTPHTLRQHEIRDCRGQAASPLALWTATTITAEEYL
jgi:hypothetical protein